MILPTLGLGLLPEYAVIGVWAPILMLMLRFMQGIAVGGELPAACVFVSEHVPSARVGYACGLLCAGVAGGTLLGALIAALVNSLFTQDQIQDWAWRVPFLLGGMFGLIAIYLRRHLQETPVFLRMREEKRLAKKWPLKIVFKEYKRAVIVSMLLTCFLASGVVIVTLMTPSYLQNQVGVAANVVFRANALAVTAMIAGCIVVGRIIDTRGNGGTFIVGSVLLGLSCTIFYHSALDATTLYILYPVVGLSLGITAAVPPVIVKAFPAPVRFSGFAFSFNAAYAICGGLIPVGIAWWLKFNSKALAHSMLGVSILGIGLGIYFLIRESKIDNAPVR